jgi:hypothetical protein
MMRLGMQAMFFFVGVGKRWSRRLRDGDVPISAVAGDCCDTGAIYLRDGVRQAVGHYAMGRVVEKQDKKQRTIRSQYRCDERETEAGLFFGAAFFD